MKTPQAINRSDYRPPVYFAKECEVRFDIQKDSVFVSSTITFQRNPEADKASPLILDGEELKIISLKIDRISLVKDRYSYSDNTLIVTDIPDKFLFEAEVEIDPFNNKALQGFYKSGDILCTQNEAEGFRRITFFPDRPDVMCRFSTIITAERSRYPHLLSNGNLVEERDLGDGRHSVRWEDPFPKPCYLFAVVTGDFGLLADSFVTASGRSVELRIYTDPGKEKYALFAMESLKEAMKWDEENFGREYDLDLYMIVAVDSFNYGAMENKGLNIFNSSVVFADEETATDAEYQTIAAVIGHEYFHNWTGNRITCRDWFQITLKEGLTVYRDEEFTADTSSRPVKRIHDVLALRDRQYPEDAGPNRHPIRPESYIEVDNFYTTTVYRKGAAVIRAMAEITGKERFRKGTDHYFRSFDGHAVTCDDFVDSIEEGSGCDLSAIRRWYSQAGTPEARFSLEWNEERREALLHVSTFNPAAPDALPPGYLLDVALFSEGGKRMDSKRHKITRGHETIAFEGISSKPVPSLLRGHTAPVKVQYDYTDGELLLLFAHETDTFNRFDSIQRLLLRLILRRIDAPELKLQEALITSFKGILNDSEMDNGYKAFLMQIPSLQAITDAQDIPAFEEAHQARTHFAQELAALLKEELFKAYETSSAKTYSRDQSSIAQRSLRNVTLGLLTALGGDAIDLAARQYRGADNMTDAKGALMALIYNQPDSIITEELLDDYYRRWKDNFLLLTRWFALQVSRPLPETLGRVEALAKDSDFNCENPNMIRALYGTLAANLSVFHDASGYGYELLAEEIVRVDSFNPMVSAHLATTFRIYPRLTMETREKMKRSLEPILAKKEISKGLFEIITKTLSSDS